MSLAGFAKEHGDDFTAGAKGFFSEAHAFDADGSGFSGKSAAEGDAESFKPAIVAAGEEGGRGRSGGRAGIGRAGGVGWCGHAEWRVARLGETEADDVRKQ